MASDLSPAKAILLAIHYASEGNVKALHSITPLRPDDLKPELLLRILLTYLPETLEPREYTPYLSVVATTSYPKIDPKEVEVDCSPVADIDDEQARKAVRRLKLLDIIPPSFPPDAPDDLLTRFVCHRAHRIDAETGLLNLIPSLVEPFLDRNDFLRFWYVGIALPLVRLQLEYNPEHGEHTTTLAEFQELDGEGAVRLLLSQTTEPQPATETDVARDIKGLVGPWVYGHTNRKRRKLQHDKQATAEARDQELLGGTGVEISGEMEPGQYKTDWDYLYQWIVSESRENFPLVVDTVEHWDGPNDIDLGQLDHLSSTAYLDDSTQSELRTQHAQAIFASCYAVEQDSLETIRGAHRMLARLATLLDFSPPPDLASSVESLPQLRRHASFLSASQTSMNLETRALLQPGHPLTTPSNETYMLLQMLVYSAYQLAGLNFPISLMHAARLYFYATADEQMATLRSILRTISKDGLKRDEGDWDDDRARLLWLWNRNIESNNDGTTTSAGILGKIPRRALEEELLKSYIDTNCYAHAIRLYLSPTNEHLPAENVERIVLMKAMEAYDGASNGNRTRGGMKKANDMVTAFRPHFPQSIGFRQAAALISATHALSFYSLTLQHGVPFQPVSIRVSQDPVGLIGKLLEQNPASYTKLDDLVSIGRNLVSAGLSDNSKDEDGIALSGNRAERRVTFMAIQAALHEDDFETAYSYIVNRLTPSSNTIEAPGDVSTSGKRHARHTSKGSTRSSAADAEDDTSWRAAFLAGRFRPATSSPPSLRRLEQRTELLSLAMLLAPVSSLSEILAAWRRCEEEMTSLQLSQQQAEQDFDDRADKRQSTSSIPGNFTVQDEQPALMYNQQRREVGRTTGKPSNDDAPVSMFDLTRSAAQALSKNAFPLRGATRSSVGSDVAGMESSVDSLGSEVEGQQRTRKRDMVANAVSGGLASGLGWVLGATPASNS